MTSVLCVQSLFRQLLSQPPECSIISGLHTIDGLFVRIAATQRALPQLAAHVLCVGTRPARGNTVISRLSLFIGKSYPHLWKTSRISCAGVVDSLVPCAQYLKLKGTFQSLCGITASHVIDVYFVLIAVDHQRALPQLAAHVLCVGTRPARGNTVISRSSLFIGKWYPHPWKMSRISCARAADSLVPCAQYLKAKGTFQSLCGITASHVIDVYFVLIAVDHAALHRSVRPVP